MSATGSADPITTPPAERLPREVWTLVAVSFLVAIGFGLVAPALPSFARSFDVSVTAVSIVISVFAFTRLVFAPLSGRLVTRLGEGKVHITGLLIVAVTTGICAFATAYWHLLVLRGIAGIGSTMFTVSALALLIRLSPPSMRGRATGVWATSFLLGNVTGPLVGGGLIEVSLRAPFLVYAVSLILAAAVAAVMLRGSAFHVVDDPTAPAPLTMREALHHRAYRAALMSNFTAGWAVFGVRVSLVPLFVVEVLGRSESLSAIALSVFAAGNVAVLLGAGKVADTIGRRPPMLVGLLVAGGATVAMGFMTNVVAFMIMSLIAGAGAGLITPAQSATVADVVGGRGRGGSVLAGFQMSADIGAIVGPIIGGVLADQLSYSTAFAVTGVVILLSVIGWWFAPETLPRTVEPDPDPVPDQGYVDEGHCPTGVSRH